ncbi:hypothetical protein JG687_00016424 [Phytophthora cactorum]|uniref:FLYWCH-type domain-containing protein n=1 Tax=Phytophthora cactorum TaxID=29920 RepID=A0A8T1TUH8_9STRA|nr:hypothetical protein PC120_g23457 [Phytophthora cactorum]KAG3044289.1 hypothetical protein PC121_g21992 [Phytophthora cactorum]KAG4040457.1 hypothetical protein PC123_g24004 [Phytophthora cactorum]KAG6946945.1 hypothetical protein JG687_00016424 [Phytophthora cactorum]
MKESGDTAYKTTIHWKGFQMTTCYMSESKTTYRCSYYRGRRGGPGCLAKLDVISQGRGKEKRFPHTCCSTSRRNRERPPTSSQPNAGKVIEISDDSSEGQEEPVAPPEPEDVSQLIAEETDILAVQQISAPPSQIWNLIRETFTVGAITRGLTRVQVSTEPGIDINIRTS